MKTGSSGNSLHFKALKEIVAKVKTLPLVLLLFLVPLQAQNRQWKNGKLLDSSVQHFAIHTKQTYTIDDGTSVYTVSRIVSSRWTKPAKVRVNMPVKFAVENDSCSIMDDDGKEYDLKVVK